MNMREELVRKRDNKYGSKQVVMALKHREKKCQLMRFMLTGRRLNGYDNL